MGSHRGELAAFDEPRFHDSEPAEPVSVGASPRDHLRGYALVARAVLAVIVIGLAPTVGDGDRASELGWLVALVWLPGIGVLDLLERRGGSGRALAVAALVWDVLLFAAVDAFLDVPGVAAVGYLLVTAVHAYLGGAAFGAASAVAGCDAYVSKPFDLASVSRDVTALAEQEAGSLAETRSARRAQLPT